MDALACYEEKFRLRISDYDCNDHITPVALLDLAQDVAGKHADLLNIGFNDFMKKNHIWILVRTRLEIVKYPPLYATLKVKTWPREKGRVDFDRDTLITDENDDVVCKMQSKWVIVNYLDRKMILPRNFDYPIKEICQDKTFDTPFNKIDDFDIDGIDPIEIKASYSDLDHNGHVNNIKYVQYITNALRLDKNTCIKYLEINYLHELREKDTFNLYIKKEGNLILAKAINGDETSFICKIECSKLD